MGLGKDFNFNIQISNGLLTKRTSSKILYSSQGWKFWPQKKAVVGYILMNCPFGPFWGQLLILVCELTIVGNPVFWWTWVEWPNFHEFPICFALYVHIWSYMCILYTNYRSSSLKAGAVNTQSIPRQVSRSAISGTGERGEASLRSMRFW